jgi:hypothetical protein
MPRQSALNLRQHRKFEEPKGPESPIGPPFTFWRARSETKPSAPDKGYMLFVAGT